MYSKASDNTSRTKLVQCSCRSCGTNLNQETLFREGTEISASLSNRFICGVRFLTTIVQLPQWCSVRLICSTVRFENTLEVGCAVIFCFRSCRAGRRAPRRRHANNRRERHPRRWCVCAGQLATTGLGRVALVAGPRAHLLECSSIRPVGSPNWHCRRPIGPTGRPV